MKKKIIIILAVLSILIPNQVYSLTTDNTPPILNSISVAKKEYIVGEKVYLDLDATDDISGISTGSIFLFNVANFDDHIYTDILDIDTKPYFEIPSGTKTGEYQLLAVTIQDTRRNIGYYSDKSKLPDNTHSSVEDYIQKTFDMKIKVTNPGMVESDDYAKLKKISFENKKVKSGNKQKIIAEVETKDQIQTVIVTVCAYNSNGMNKLQDIDLKLNKNTNKYEASFDVSVVNGKYEIYNVSITNVNGNVSRFGFKQDDPASGTKNYSDDLHSYYYGSEVTYEVIGGTSDDQPPILKSIRFNKTKSDAPSRVYAVLDIEEKSKLSSGGIYLVRKDIDNNEGDSMIIGTIEYSKKLKRYYSIINIDQFVAQGTYHIAYIDLNDEYGNRNTYSVDSRYDYGNMIENDYELVIYDSINADYTTSTTSKNMLDIIKKADDNAIIMIDGTNSTKIPKEVFEIIKDTNKTIYIEYYGIQWVFNGKDIVNPKDIDAKFKTEEYYDEDNNIAGVDLEFAANGELPGKAKVRVKAEYTHLYEFYKDLLYVYYYDEAEDAYYLVADGIGESNDGYYEFNILHNSTYKLTEFKQDNAREDSVLTSNKIYKKEVKETKNKSTKLNKSNRLLIIIPSIIGSLLVIVLVVFFIIKKKNKKIVETKDDTKNIIEENEKIITEAKVGEETKE